MPGLKTVVGVDQLQNVKKQEAVLYYCLNEIISKFLSILAQAKKLEQLLYDTFWKETVVKHFILKYCGECPVTEVPKNNNYVLNRIVLTYNCLLF